MDDKKQRTGEISHVSRESSNVQKLWLPFLSDWIIFKWWFNLIDKNITMFFAVQKVLLPPSLEICDQICFLPSATWNTKWGAFSLQKHGQSLNVLCCYTRLELLQHFSQVFHFFCHGADSVPTKVMLNTDQESLFISTRRVRSL